MRRASPTFATPKNAISCAASARAPEATPVTSCPPQARISTFVSRTIASSSTSRILAAISGDERAVLPISSRHTFDGLGDVCLSLPTIVGRRGAVGVVDVPMNAHERAGLLASATAIKTAIAALS